MGLGVGPAQPRIWYSQGTTAHETLLQKRIPTGEEGRRQGSMWSDQPSGLLAKYQYSSQQISGP